VHVNLPFRDPLVPDDDASGWPEPLDGRAGGGPWTRHAPPEGAGAGLEIDWSERGLVVCGDGDYDTGPLPVLAEPSSGARQGPNALPGYQYLLASRAFMAACRPRVIVSAGRPGPSRPQ